MNIKLTLSIIISKIVLIGCRLFRLGGTTLPGKIALRIYPDILAQLSGNYKIIMVTGTNGKTTTTRIIGRILLENDIKYISNTSGANLIGGITTTFVKASNIFGKSKVNTALFEVDEGVFHVICRHIKPDILVVTNFFRDQLDRYGELHNTIKSVSAGIKQSKDVILVLNADDSLSSSLGKDINRKIVYYGISQYALQDNHQYGNIDENAGKDINMDTNIDAAFCFFLQIQIFFQLPHLWASWWFHLPGVRVFPS